MLVARMLLSLGLILLFLPQALAFNQHNSLMLQETMEPQSLHPLNIEGYDALGVRSYVLEQLLRKSEKTNEWTPVLATKWEIDPKANVFTFWLREGVKWSDGKPFTAHDVKFSFDV